MGKSQTNQIKQAKQMQQRQARMNRRDQAELIELITTWNKRKRGMIPRGHKLIVTLDVAPITPSPIVEIRVSGKSNGAKVPKAAPSQKRCKKLKGDLKSIMEMPLIDLGLRTSIYNVLTKLKIKKIGGLFTWVSTREPDLLLTPKFGHGSLKECRDKLKAQGFEID